MCMISSLNIHNPFCAGSRVAGASGAGAESSHSNIKVIWWSKEKTCRSFGTIEQSTDTVFGRTNYVSTKFLAVSR